MSTKQQQIEEQQKLEQLKMQQIIAYYRNRVDAFDKDR
jgi:hypothetical protein